MLSIAGLLKIVFEDPDLENWRKRRPTAHVEHLNSSHYDKENSLMLLYFLLRNTNEVIKAAFAFIFVSFGLKSINATKKIKDT